MAAETSCFLVVLLMIVIHSQVRAEFSPVKKITEHLGKASPGDTTLRFRSKHLNVGDRKKYKDCDAVRIAGYKQHGYYRVWYNSSVHYDVVCHHEGDVSYVLIQQRLHGTVSFVRDMNTFISGFGHTSGDYWAGLNQITYLTGTGYRYLHVLLQDWSNVNGGISYGHFQVIGPQYTMYISNPYLGNVTDDLSAHSGSNFYTYDRPDSRHCATAYKGGWWYINSPTTCAHALLNGKYYTGGPYIPSPYSDGIFWNGWRGVNYSLRFSAMYVSTQYKQIGSFPNSYK